VVGLLATDRDLHFWIDAVLEYDAETAAERRPSATPPGIRP